MNFAAPAAFWWTLLALPIIGFYLLKVRRRQVETSTTMFWNQIYDDAPPRSIWELLKHLLSLFAQLVLLALLILACSDPVFSWQTLSARKLVLVLDPSASMQVIDERQQSRWDAACQQANKVIDGLRFRDEMAILIAGKHPTVASGFTGHLPTLKSVLRGLAPTDEPTAILPAVELGTLLLADHPHAKLIVISDGCSPEWSALKERPLVQRISVIHDSDAEHGNVGLTQFHVRRSLIDPLGYDVLISARNASAETINLRVELRLDDVLVDILPIQLGPEANWRRSLEKTSLKGGTLTARLTRMSVGETPFRDALPLDNHASAIIPAREIQQVHLVTPGNLFLQKAFESNPLVQLTVAEQIPSNWPESDLIVLHRHVPQQLPSGNVWVIDPDNDCDLFQIGGILENPIVTEQDKSSPLMLHVKLDNVVMPQARKLTFVKPPEVVAGSLTNDAIYAHVKRSSGKALVLTTNLDEGDLTLRTAFPILVTNALGWFGGATGEIQTAIATGEYASIPLPTPQSEVKQWSLRRPDGKQIRLTLPAEAKSDRDEWQIGPFNQVGRWQLETPSDSPGTKPSVVKTFSCNLSDPDESDLRAKAPSESDSSPRIMKASWLSYPLWSLFLLLAIVLVTLEWGLSQRRIIR